MNSHVRPSTRSCQEHNTKGLLQSLPQQTRRDLWKHRDLPALLQHPHVPGLCFGARSQHVMWEWLHPKPVPRRALRSLWKNPALELQLGSAPAARQGRAKLDGEGRGMKAVWAECVLVVPGVHHSLPVTLHRQSRKDGRASFYSSHSGAQGISPWRSIPSCMRLKYKLILRVAKGSFPCRTSCCCPAMMPWHRRVLEMQEPPLGIHSNLKAHPKSLETLLAWQRFK